MKSFLESRYAIIGMAVIIIVMVFIIIYCLVFARNAGKLTYDDYTILDGHFGQVEKYDASHAVEGYKGDGKNAYYITGKIKAKSNKDFTLITFNLYDKSNKVLGTAVFGLNEMQKGRAYDFKAVSLEKMNVMQVDHYKIKSIENMEVK